MITRVEATKYRCFEQLDMKLGEYGVLVGANGAGKTTLLDIPVLLGDLLRQPTVGEAFLKDLQPRGARAISFTELVHQGRGDWFILAIEAALPERVVRDLLEGASTSVRQNEELWPKFLRYELRLQVFNERELHVQNEYLFTFSDKWKPERDSARLHGEVTRRKEWRFILSREYGGPCEFRVETTPGAKASSASLGASRLALARILYSERKDYPAAHWLIELLTDKAVFFDPAWAQLRSASPPGQTHELRADGRSIPWLAKALKESSPERFADWKEHVATALPQITDIDAIERDDDHHAYLAVTYNDQYEVTSSGLSDGTLRILALTLIPYLDDPPHYVVVEEPENGIHPRAIEAVLQSLGSVYGSQVVVSSHSPIVVAQTELEDIHAARMEKTGAVSVVAGPDHPRLAEWKGTIDLGSLFAAGVLG